MARSKKIFVLILPYILLIYSCGVGVSFAQSALFHDFFIKDEQELLAQMSIEEKIGQVLMFGFWGTKPDKEIQTWLSTGKMGNVKLTIRNIKSQKQLKQLTDSIVNLTLKTKHGIPPFIATDVEGGTVIHVRYPGAFYAPAAGLVGATEDTRYSAASSRLIALTLHQGGINMNFAPCADVITTPLNRVIGTRSYGSSPELVFSMTRAFIEEHEKFGIFTTVKHFPGHGMTDFDSHLVSKGVDTSREELYDVHIYPYMRLFMENDLQGLMVSHVIYNEVDPIRPATFSPLIVRGLVRHTGGFQGLVVTDDLEMKGAMDFAKGIDQAFILSFKAGNDISLVMHTKQYQARLIRNIGKFFADGTLNERELDEKVLRVLRAKKIHLSRFYALQNDEIKYDGLIQQAAEECKEASTEGIMLLSSRIEGSIPAYFHDARGKKLKGIVLAPTKKFAALAGKHLKGWDTVYIGYNPSYKENVQKLDSMRRKLKTYDLAVIGIANERQARWARAFASEKIPMALLSVHNPYFAWELEKDALFVATSFSPFSPAIDALFFSVFVTGEFPGTFPYFFQNDIGSY
jgi:beta-N-acetylhexosaminidase